MTLGGNGPASATLGAVDSALEAVELRANVNVGDLRVGQDLVARRSEVVTRHNVSRFVSNPIVLPVAPDDRWCQVSEPRGQFVPFVALALMRVQEDRSDLCVGLYVRKRPVREHKLFVSLCNQLQTVATRVRLALRNPPQGRLPVCIRGASPVVASELARNASNCQFHRGSSRRRRQNWCEPDSDEPLPSLLATFGRVIALPFRARAEAERMPPNPS